MKNEYKIVEIDGGYCIKVKVIITTGILWWKKTTEELVDVDYYGEPNYFYSNNHPLGGFANLEDAKIIIKTFKN